MFSLGLERAGMRTIAFCEQDKFCQLVLKKHWPSVPIYQDVTMIKKDLRPDIVCGGFPCQDISLAGKQKGIQKNTRSGLWFHFHHLIDTFKPKYAIIENVANLRSNGLVRVLQNLWESGYDAEWAIISAKNFGLPHTRDRIWIVAYRTLDTGRVEKVKRKKSKNTDCSRHNWSRPPIFFKSRVDSNTLVRPPATWAQIKPGIRRGHNGSPTPMDKIIERERKCRLKALGNSLIPQIVEWIGLKMRDQEFLA